MCWASARCKSQCGSAGYGRALARSGVAGHGVARSGLGCRRQHGGATFPAALYESCFGRAVLGAAVLGEAGMGRAGPGKGHRRWHGGFTLPCHPHKDGCGKPWPDVFRHGRVRWGELRHGEAWTHSLGRLDTKVLVEP